MNLSEVQISSKYWRVGFAPKANELHDLGVINWHILNRTHAIRCLIKCYARELSSKGHATEHL